MENKCSSGATILSNMLAISDSFSVIAGVDLTHAFVPALLERSPGAAIITVASTAGFQPLPYMAVYGASKAFVLSFSQALAEEYHTRGLRVLALCPGATETAFFDIAGESASFGRKRTPEQVVATEQAGALFYFIMSLHPHKDH